MYVASLPPVVSVEISASGDDGFQLYLDGELIMEDSNWKVATRKTVLLKRGRHVIAVKGTNAAGGSDAGAIIVDVLGPDFRIASSSDWEVSLDAGDTWNQLNGTLLLPEPATEYGAVDSRRWWNRGGTDSTGASLEGANFPLIHLPNGFGLVALRTTRGFILGKSLLWSDAILYRKVCREFLKQEY